MKRYVRSEQAIEKYRGIDIGQEDKPDQDYYARVKGRLVRGQLVEEVKSKIDEVLDEDVTASTVIDLDDAPFLDLADAGLSRLGLYGAFTDALHLGIFDDDDNLLVIFAFPGYFRTVQSMYEHSGDDEMFIEKYCDYIKKYIAHS